MKKSILVILATLVLLPSLSMARPLTIRVDQQALVMLDAQLVRSISLVLGDVKVADEKIANIRALLYVSTLEPVARHSFCDVAGVTYKTVNSSAEDISTKCKKVILSRDFVDQLVKDTPDYKTLRELNLALSVQMAFNLKM